MTLTSTDTSASPGSLSGVDANSTSSQLILRLRSEISHCTRRWTLGKGGSVDEKLEPPKSVGPAANLDKRRREEGSRGNVS